jgi:hypothetical protein
MFEITHSQEQSSSRSSTLAIANASARRSEASETLIGEVLDPVEPLSTGVPPQCPPDYDACHVRTFPTKGRFVDVLA